MGEYRDLETRKLVQTPEGKFDFPTSGAKMLLKTRPPIAKEVSTD